MTKLREETLLHNLQAINLEALAQQTGIENSYTKKVHAHDLLLSFLLLINQDTVSLSAWASLFSQLTDETITKQAMALKFDTRYQAFFEAVLAALLQQRFGPEAAEAGSDPAGSDLWQSFRRVLVEDSTCLSLPDGLSACFPSSYCPRGQKATARLQWLHDLKAERVVRFALQSYRDNDQKHARAILEQAQAGDLVLRDLGYFSGPVFAALNEAGVFFLSRLHYRVQVLDAQSSAVVDVVRLLERPSVRAAGYLDTTVLLGARQQLPVRLVGLRLPEQVARARRRRARARARRDRRRGYSARYGKWLSWSFFVTNVPETTWSQAEVARAYRLRWRIEMIFKGLKQHGQFDRLMGGSRLSYVRVMMSLLGVLIYALVVVWPYYRYFRARIARLSLLKFMAWLRRHLVWVLLARSVCCFEAQVGSHCLYERRRKRRNYLELRYA